MAAKSVIDREDAKQLAERLTLSSAVASLQPPYGQAYALVSVVWPEGPQPAKEFGINVLGAFRTLEEAKEHGKALDNENYPFARWIIQMNSMAALPPPTKPEQGKEYQNKILGRVMDSYKKRIITEDKLYEERLNQSRENETKAREEAKNARDTQRDKETIEGLCKQIQEFNAESHDGGHNSADGYRDDPPCDRDDHDQPDCAMPEAKNPFKGLRCTIGQPQTTRPPGVVMPAKMSKNGVITM